MNIVILGSKANEKRSLVACWRLGYTGLEELSVKLTRMFAILLVGIAVSGPVAAQSLVDQLYGQRAYELADAYWAAGLKFIALGQADRGATFKAAALRIFPGYVPGQAPAISANQPAVAPPQTPAPEVPSVQVVREANLQGEKIAKLQFQKLLRGFLTGRLAGAVFGPSLTVQGNEQKTDIAAFNAYLGQHPTAAGSPADLFDLSSLAAIDGQGDQVLVTVRANPNAPEDVQSLSFWKPQQTYTFDRIDDTWKLVGIQGN